MRGAGALIGAPLFYLVTSGAIWRTGVPDWLSLSGTGSWSGYLGAMAGAALCLRLRKASPWPYLDAAASLAGLGIFIGRWACFLNGDDFGRTTDAAWGIRFPRGSYPYLARLGRGELSGTEQLSLAVHPFQLVLAVNGLVVLLVASAVWRSRKRVPGYTLAFFWLLYGATRFVWEFLRDPSAGGRTTWLSVAQWMSLAFLAAGALVMWHVRRRGTVTDLPVSAR